MAIDDSDALRLARLLVLNRAVGMYYTMESGTGYERMWVGSLGAKQLEDFSMSSLYNGDSSHYGHQLTTTSTGSWASIVVVPKHKIEQFKATYMVL